MAIQPKSPVRYAFGPFEVDAAGELRKKGVRLRLSGQPLQILLTLLAHPGEVATREQLREEVWNETTFVDFEHGLNAAMNKLRRALGDSAENPRYIETVPGRGYRFIGAAEPDHVVPAFPPMSLSFRKNGVTVGVRVFGGGLRPLRCSWPFRLRWDGYFMVLPARFLPGRLRHLQPMLACPMLPRYRRMASWSLIHPITI